MLRTCSICGKMHDINKQCPNFKPIRNSKADKFRNTAVWRKKRDEIKKRDRYLCRYCFDVKHRVNTNNLSVHHIESIEKAYHKRLCDDNLITLCDVCHKKAETGKIDRSILASLAQSPPVPDSLKLQETQHRAGPTCTNNSRNEIF